MAPAVMPMPSTADATSLAEATGGPTDVGFTITLTETASTTVTVDYAVVAPNATFLAGTDFGGTLPSGQVASVRAWQAMRSPAAEFLVMAPSSTARPVRRRSPR